MASAGNQHCATCIGTLSFPIITNRFDKWRMLSRHRCCSAHTQTTYDDRSFAVSGPVAWNTLPVALRSSDVTEETFRKQLKTFLFNCLDN